MDLTFAASDCLGHRVAFGSAVEAMKAVARGCPAVGASVTIETSVAIMFCFFFFGFGVMVFVDIRRFTRGGTYLMIQLNDCNQYQFDVKLNKK